jgi:hypothetical protein
MRDHILVYFSGFSYPAGGGLAGPSSYGIYRKVTLFGATSPTFSAARKRYRTSSEPVKTIMNARTLLTAASLVAAAIAVAPAQAATSIGTFKQWGAYTSSDSNGKMCFVASQPQDSKYQPDNVSSRDPVFFMVTSIPAKNIRNEASTIIGYPFADDVKVTVAIDGDNTFTMFTEKDSAWIEDPTQESGLIAAMKGGTRMTVVGKSRRGTLTTDTYSLSGVTAALEAIAKECP